MPAKYDNSELLAYITMTKYRIYFFQTNLITCLPVFKQTEIYLLICRLGIIG